MTETECEMGAIWAPLIVSETTLRQKRRRFGPWAIIARKPHVASKSFFEQRDPATLVLVALRVLFGHAYPETPARNSCHCKEVLCTRLRALTSRIICSSLRVFDGTSRGYVRASICLSKNRHTRKSGVSVLLLFLSGSIHSIFP